MTNPNETDPRNGDVGRPQPMPRNAKRIRSHPDEDLEALISDVDEEGTDSDLNDSTDTADEVELGDLDDVGDNETP